MHQIVIDITNRGMRVELGKRCMICGEKVIDNPSYRDDLCNFCLEQAIDEAMDILYKNLTPEKYEIVTDYMKEKGSLI